MNILLWAMNNLFVVIRENYYRSSPGGLYKGCAIGDDIIIVLAERYVTRYKAPAEP